MNIADYTVSIKFDINKKEWQRLDNQLKALERRLSKFNTGLTKNLSIKIGSFNVDQKKLNFALGNALDIASRTTAFGIDRFIIDQQSLNRRMSAAVRQASLVAARGANISPNVHSPRGGGAVPTRRLAGAGGAAGLVSRAYLPALAIAGGGYGLGAINRRNQEVVSAQLQSQAVVQQALGSAYTPEQGKASFDWLRKQADRIGFNYLDASPDYNKLLSGLTGAGMSIEQGQDVYKGFAELSRVNKLDRVQQQRVFRALSQVAGKNKLQSEELFSRFAS